MTVLALDVDETTLWQVLLVVVTVVVVGVLALITTLLFIVRSISGSIRQLREVAAEQAAQVGMQPDAQAPGAQVTAPHTSPSDAAGVEGHDDGSPPEAAGVDSTEDRSVHQSEVKGSTGSTDA
jgi:hypothetical protein